MPTRHPHLHRREVRVGKAAHGQVREDGGAEFRYCANSRTANYHHAWNRPQNHAGFQLEPTGKRKLVLTGPTNNIGISALKIS
jgi:hypothetical protein